MEIVHDVHHPLVGTEVVDMYEKFGTGVHGAGKCTYTSNMKGPGGGCALQIPQKCGELGSSITVSSGGKGGLLFGGHIVSSHFSMSCCHIVIMFFLSLSHILKDCL